MKWYTRAWQRGDDPAVDPSVAYSDYIRGLDIPDHVRAFAIPERRHLATDDAKVDRAELDGDKATLRLRLLNGDLLTGYGRLQLDFASAVVVEPSIDEASRLLADRSTEFLVHEVELVAPGAYEVRFLLYPRGELHVRCRDVRATWEAIADQTRTDYRSEVVGFSAGAVT
jgi:hypothetical protein